ncbi:hypothetical protein ATCV1_z186R [Acanthocystis turfacea chlorella virus 1]|uniref:Uncharacterized protein z186R n=1 Tax=Chlorovirus heliozoae TaxID=322019 RepID=A7K8E6_9PHYC|nr:hypothetical protein ATCV1_z186R [Acanthocystis turfacea chlorella virus 1]ABT16320.1 hypothetical protein ATCV1_z186R [Acanthocystis turfacea chlorella virus 1]
MTQLCSITCPFGRKYDDYISFLSRNPRNTGKRGAVLTPCEKYLNFTILPMMLSRRFQRSSRVSLSNPVPMPNRMPFHSTSSAPSISRSILPSLWLVLRMSPSSFIFLSLTFVCNADTPITTASSSSNCLIFTRICSFSVERPNLYFPPALRTITPSNPWSRHHCSNTLSSSAVSIFLGISGTMVTRLSLRISGRESTNFFMSAMRSRYPLSGSSLT